MLRRSKSIVYFRIDAVPENISAQKAVPTELVVAVSVGGIAVIATTMVVYFKKRKRLKYS